MHLLHNRVQAYAWGSVTAIPELLGVEPTGEPQAELWMGAHRQLPSLVDVDGARVSLADLIAADPVRALGPAVIARFGPELPFLVKVLAAVEPLSLQAHPSKEHAALGHDREERAGIAVDAANRSYRDRNHKPELLCALTRFEALCGFRAADEAVAVLAALAGPRLRPWVDTLAADRSADGRRRFLGRLLTQPRPQAGALVDELAANAEAGALPDPDDAGLLRRLAATHPGDPGVVVAALLNRVVLEPGEALFLGPGNLHAYVEGVGVEVMASSDNVLRGGLTPKPVDVQELLRILDVDAVRPPLLRACPSRAGEAVYDTPAEEFVLSVTRVGADPVELVQDGPSIVLCTEGTVELVHGGEHVRLGRGGAAFVPASVASVALRGDATVFRVTTALR